MPPLDPRDRLRSELKQLISEGGVLLMKYLITTATPEQAARLLEGLSSSASPSSPTKKKKKVATGSEPPTDGFLGDLDNFNLGSHYQPWYSKALRVVEQLLPDRYDEFRSLYRVEKRKALDVNTYGIYEAIHGLTVTRLGAPDFRGELVALTKLQQQVELLKAAQARLDSILTDIRGVLEAGLFDQELAAAGELLKGGHTRSAGVIAGVVLERHLQGLLSNHHVTMRKKPTIANLNDALKTAAVLDVPRWRQIQHLADVRNLCAHHGDRAPTQSEVEGLLSGVEQIVKTTF